MTTATAAMAQALAALPDAPREVQQSWGAQLLYALGLATRPNDTDEETAA